MSNLWPFIRPEIKRDYIEEDILKPFLEKTIFKNSLHAVYYTSLDKIKRIELSDAIDKNTFHLFFYMLARFYFFDNGGDIYFYYPASNRYLPEVALANLPSYFHRETEKHPDYEYIEMPGCLWYTSHIDEPWIYSYVRDLYKPLWESIPQVKGKYSYISRNPRDTQARRCLNESELIDPLKRIGFSMYTLEQITFEDQIRLFRSSEFITGLHGAGLAWLIFCAPETTLFEIHEINGHKQHYEDICRKCNITYWGYTNAKKPDLALYPDAKPSDCVLDAKEYISILKILVENQKKGREQK